MSQTRSTLMILIGTAAFQLFGVAAFAQSHTDPRALLERVERLESQLRQQASDDIAIKRIDALEAIVDRMILSLQSNDKSLRELEVGLTRIIAQQLQLLKLIDAEHSRNQQQFAQLVPSQDNWHKTLPWSQTGFSDSEWRERGGTITVVIKSDARSISITKTWQPFVNEQYRQPYRARDVIEPRIAANPFRNFADIDFFMTNCGDE